MKHKVPFNNINIGDSLLDGIPMPEGEDPSLGKALFMDFMNRVMKPEEERTAPDKSGCETIFTRAFITDEMYWDFPVIVKDFLKHECANIQDYSDLSYEDGRPENSEMGAFWQRTMLHAMYEAFKRGSGYARELFKYLFRTYYPKLYKSFKRFSAISMDEVISLATESGSEYMDTYLVAVLLCMAEVYGVHLKEDCDALYYMLNDKYSAIEEGLEVEFLEFPEGMFQECKDEVKEIFGDDLYRLFRKKLAAQKFAANTLRYHGYPEEYVILNMERHTDIWLHLARVLALLKMTYPGRDFTREDILLYANIYDAINALTSSADTMYDAWTGVFGLGDDAQYIEDECIFDPEKVIVPGTRPCPQKVSEEKTSTPVKGDEREYSQTAMQREIEELRLRLRTSEQENKQLRHSLQMAKRQQEEQHSIVEEYENSRKELAALREHLYHFTEYDEPEKETDMESVVRRLADKKITIIGGNKYWVQKMKKILPKWNYISPQVSVSNDAKWVTGAEFVYFFTDALSHSVYETYVRLVREHDVPFGYIHGVNIGANVRQFRKELDK